MPKSKPQIRIGNMDSLGGILAEMAKVYREARRGTVPHVTASALTHMLTQQRAVIEAIAMAGINAGDMGDAIRERPDNFTLGLRIANILGRIERESRERETAALPGAEAGEGEETRH